MYTNIPKGEAVKHLNTWSYPRLGREPEYCFKCVPTERNLQSLTASNRQFQCTIIIGEKDFSTNKTYSCKRRAAAATAKLTLDELFPYKSMLNKRFYEQGWIYSTDVDSVCSSMSDDILATHFKQIVYQLSQKENNHEPSYYTQLYSEGGITGYLTTLQFNNIEYRSLGLMTSQVQAEQSAAEVCLRSSTDILPAVQDEDEFTIQPYQGGVAKHIDIPNLHNIPYIFTTSILSDLLEAFIDVHHMEYPKYYTKYLDNSYGDGEGCGDLELGIINAICCFEGKVFKSPCPQTLPVVKQLLADEILRYFGITHPQKSLELYNHVKTFRTLHPFYTMTNCSTNLTPYYRCPSQLKGWTNRHPHQLGKYNDDDVEILFTSEAIFHPVNDDYMMKIVREEMRRTPSFKGEMLSELKDISVAEIDLSDANMYIIGNSQFSIKMLLKDGKIFSKKQQANVDLLPGHNIQGLTSEYRIMSPSLEIYLKGVECWELLSPDPPLPVVSSCGVVVLFHDYNSSKNDIYVLLRRKGVDGFAADSSKIKRFCERQLRRNKKNDLWGIIQAGNCTKNIQSWYYSEVKLLSEMTIDSFTLLMTRYCHLKSGWIKLFENEDLCPPLKALQDICLAELKIRDDAGLIQEKEDLMPWELPQSQFINMFETIGIHLENSNLCAFRAVTESAGVRIKLSEIDKSPTVDIPCEDNVKKHRGGVSRYYIWKGCHRYTFDERNRYNYYYEEVDEEDLARAGEWDVKHQQFYQTAKSIFKTDSNLQFKRQRMEKGEGKVKRKYKEDTNEDNGEEQNENEHDEPMDDTEEDAGGSTTYLEYCTWMKLDDAVLVCPVLKELSQTPQFQDELGKLITEANNFMKSNGITETVETSQIKQLDKSRCISDTVEVSLL